MKSKTANTIFKDGDLVMPLDNLLSMLDGYLPMRQTIIELFDNKPLPVKIIPIKCSCGSSNGNHVDDCLISQNYGHPQKLVIICSPYSQIQSSGAFFQIAKKA